MVESCKSMVSTGSASTTISVYDHGSPPPRLYTMTGDPDVDKPAASALPTRSTEPPGGRIDQGARADWEIGLRICDGHPAADG